MESKLSRSAESLLDLLKQKEGSGERTGESGLQRLITYLVS